MEEDKIYNVPISAVLQIEASSEESAEEIADHILYKSDWVIGYDVGNAQE